MKNASFDFNMASQVYAEKLTEQDRAKYDAIKSEAAEKYRKEREDYAKNRDTYIKHEEERLTRHYRKKLEMPVPDGFPRPRMPGAARIHQEAIDRADEGHEGRMKTIADEARKSEREFFLARDRAGPERGRDGHER